MLARLQTVGEIYAFLWRRNLGWTIPFVIILNVLVLPVLIFLGLIQSLKRFRGWAYRARLERKMKRQGKDLYPLW